MTDKVSTDSTLRMVPQLLRAAAELAMHPSEIQAKLGDTWITKDYLSMVRLFRNREGRLCVMGTTPHTMFVTADLCPKDQDTHFPLPPDGVLLDGMALRGLLSGAGYWTRGLITVGLDFEEMRAEVPAVFDNHIYRFQSWIEMQDGKHYPENAWEVYDQARRRIDERGKDERYTTNGIDFSPAYLMQLVQVMRYFVQDFPDEGSMYPFVFGFSAHDEGCIIQGKSEFENPIDPPRPDVTFDYVLMPLHRRKDRLSTMTYPITPDTKDSE